MAASSSSTQLLPELTSLASSAPASLQPLFQEMSTLYSKKLYYQLLLSVEKFFAHPDSARQGSTFRYDLYQSFVNSWKTKVADLSSVQLAVAAAKQLSEPDQALSFLVAQANEIEKDTPPHLLCSIEATHYKLLLGDLDSVKKDVDQGNKILNTYDAVETVVSAAFYRTAAEYYKAKALYQQYYTSSLLYLACLPHSGTEDDLTSDEKVERAHDLAIAAILGQNIWNFGELLLHPLLPCLNSTPDAYLLPLLSSFSSGSLPLFDSLLPSINSHPLLHSSMPFLRQKICLMALVESVSKREARQRSLSFQTIASETKLPVDEVEHLCMKALSLGLIKGNLDQAAQVAHISWVQPRVLEMEQLKALRGKLANWLARVKDTELFVENEERQGGVNGAQRKVTAGIA
ncbi:unnamed protein product [Sympodiomycopsis kandeliae]